jgi:SAM-dependent methyltransferase
MSGPMQVVALVFCFGSAALILAETSASPAEPKGSAAIPDILFIPTPNDVVDRMLELAGVKKQDLVYDLGCGDGRIVVAAAKKFGCRAMGVDIDPRRVEQSRVNAKKARVENLVKIEKQDLFLVDLRPASVVVLYLSPKANARLIPQLEKLAPGSRVVSHQFEIPGLKPDQVIEVQSKENRHKHTLYLWKTPLKKQTS